MEPPFYYILIFKISNNVAKQIIANKRKFFWGGKDSDGRLATMKWDDLEAHKDLCGFGFGNIKIQNRGMLAKWWWRFSNVQDVVWKNVVKSTHRIQSLAAKKLPFVDELFQYSFSVRLDNGANTSFWRNYWTENQLPFIDFFS